MNSEPCETKGCIPRRLTQLEKENVVRQESELRAAANGQFKRVSEVYTASDAMLSYVYMKIPSRFSDTVLIQYTALQYYVSLSGFES